MKETYPNSLGLKILGAGRQYVDFAGIAHVGDTAIWRVEFTNRKGLDASGKHKLFTPNGLCRIDQIQVGQRVVRGDGRFTRVKSVTKTDRIEPVYDILEASDGHRYVSNGVLSSNCEFVTDDETLINPMTLSYMKFKAPLFYVEQSRWYREPEPNHVYLVALDPSMGTQGDAAAIQIFMVPGMVQVAEWQSNATNPRGQMRTLLRMLHFLDNELRSHPDQLSEPEIYWTLENNSLGEANLTVLDEIGEHKFPGTLINERRRKGQTKRFRKGLTTGKHSKIAACVQFKNLIEGNRMELCSENLVTELKNFVRKEPSFAAKPGMHDDLVLATLLTIRMLQNVMQQGVDVGGNLGSAFSDEELFGEPMPVLV